MKKAPPPLAGACGPESFRRHKAILRARVTRSKLVIARLDRLSRNAAFLLTLRDSGVEFICADIPEADSMTIGILAIVAQKERELISERIRAALAAARARGKRLGHLPTLMPGVGQPAATAAAQAKAAAKASELRDIVAEVQAAGVTSYRAIAEELMTREIPSPRGLRWHPTSVRRLVLRLNEHR